jgi:Tol biopolymer transport system component
VISVQRIAYERPPTPTANDHDIYVMDPMNTSTNYDWNNPGTSGYPAWSPDCSFIVFENNSGNGGFYKISKANYSTGSPSSGTTDVTKSSSQNYRYPTVLPNGALVAYIQQTSTTQGNIFTVPVGGGTSTKLLPTSFDSFDNEWPAW